MGFLDLVNELYICNSPSFEYLPSSGFWSDRCAVPCGILKKAEITDEEMAYAQAVFGDTVNLENMLKERIKKSSDITDEEKIKGICKLVVFYCQKQALPTCPYKYVYISKSQWHDKHKKIADSLINWIDRLNANAHVKVSRQQTKERDYA